MSQRESRVWGGAPCHVEPRGVDRREGPSTDADRRTRLGLNRQSRDGDGGSKNRAVQADPFWVAYLCDAVSRAVELGDVIASGAGVSCGVLLAPPIRMLIAIL